MEKYGRQNGKQRYRCQACGRFFRSKKKPSVCGRALWETYVLRRATLANLSVDDGRSPRQLQRVLRAEAKRKKIVVHTSGKIPVVLVMDSTYFDTFGVMVFRCWNRRQNLFWKFIEEETNDLYLAGLAHLQETGFTVVGVVCDGKRWLAQQNTGSWDSGAALSVSLHEDHDTLSHKETEDRCRSSIALSRTQREAHE